jgi:flagellar M-ring protein FliF
VLNSFWAGLSRRSRVGFVVGLVAIAGATSALAYWTLRTDYDVLFSELSASDAAAMTRELEAMKLPYRLGEDGKSILVERGTVHATRLKLMGKELPLNGAVGFELFNNADFGMTEFAQKINYQRALQGEITRTILSLAEVESARVHIAFPEEGLFKRDQNRAKASVTLALKHGQSLRKDQVAGIQRLVAAAVPGIQRDDVTIVNRQGVALTNAEAADEAPGASRRLELTHEIEQHLARKATAVLEKAFGPGQAMASVDVALDMNQVRTTTEDVLTPSSGSEAPSGVILRERETLRDDPSGPRGGDGALVQASTTQREVDYQLGRKVQQVVSSPGAITRLHAVAVLKAPLTPAQLEQVKLLLGAAVGASKERGDTVVVQPLDGLAASVPVAPSIDASPQAGASDDAPAPTLSAPEGQNAVAQTVPAWWFGAPLVTLALAALVLAFRRPRRPMPQGHKALTLAERDASLRRVQAWLSQDSSGIGRVGDRP